MQQAVGHLTEDDILVVQKKIIVAQISKLHNNIEFTEMMLNAVMKVREIFIQI